MLNERKKCVSCGQSKTLEEFGRNSYSKDGKQYRCRECINKPRRDLSTEQRVQINSRQRVYIGKYLNTLGGRAHRLLNSARERSKRKNLDFDLTVEWVLKKLKKRTMRSYGYSFYYGNQWWKSTHP